MQRYFSDYHCSVTVLYAEVKTFGKLGRVKYSIEVTENDFNLFNLGDEINIEYTTFSKEFLGYY